MEIEKDLLLALVLHVFITISCIVSTSIDLHAPLILKKCPFLLEEIPIGLSLFPKSQLHSIFSSKNGHFFNINGACKVIDVDTRHEDVIKTWKTSANNMSFFIYQEPTSNYFLKLKYVRLGLWKLRKTYY